MDIWRQSPVAPLGKGARLRVRNDNETTQQAKADRDTLP